MAIVAATDAVTRDDQQPGHRLPGKAHGEDRRIDAIGYVFVAFFTVPFFVFNILPVFFGIYVSFTRWSIVGSPHWIGLENFSHALHDQWVGVAFKNALLYGLLIVPGVTV